jgi:hypothetical protein
MASTFVEVVLDDMERFLRRAYRALHPKKGDARGEIYYDLNLSDRKIFIRVWTSIHKGSGVGAEKGADAIRVTMITSGGKPLMPKAKIVKRTKNWRSALQDRIEEFLEVYEEKAEYWKHRRRERDGEAAETRSPFEPERSQSEPEPIVEAKPPTSAGDTFEAGYRKLRNGVDWGVVIQGKGSKGDVALAVTKGGKPTRVRLLVKDSSGPDRYNGNKYSEVWEFEKLEGGRKYAGEDEPASLEGITANVADRFLQRYQV